MARSSRLISAYADLGHGVMSTQTIRVIVFPCHLLLGALNATHLVVLLVWISGRRDQANVVRAAQGVPVGQRR